MAEPGDVGRKVVILQLGKAGQVVRRHVVSELPDVSHIGGERVGRGFFDFGQIFFKFPKTDGILQIHGAPFPS